MSYIWGKNAWVYRSRETSALCPLYPLDIRKKVLDKYSASVFAETEFIRVKDYYQQMIMAADAGYYQHY